jgi:hypothetical protein
MIILDMLNILRTHGISPSGIPSNISLMPNHKLVNEIRKLRAKLNTEKYKQAQAVYKKVIKPINIAFIKTLYAQQYYTGMNNNPLIDLEYLFGQYDNDNIENPALYRLLKEHRLQRNLFKFIILTDYCNRKDNSDKLFEKLIKQLEKLKESESDGDEINNICTILDGLYKQKPEFIRLGLAKTEAMIGGAYSEKSICALVTFCALAIKDSSAVNTCKDIIKVVDSNPEKIISGIDEIKNNSAIPQEEKPLYTATIINPVTTDKVSIEAATMQKTISTFKKEERQKVKTIYLQKVIEKPEDNNFKLIAETTAHIPSFSLPSMPSDTPDELKKEYAGMGTSFSVELSKISGKSKSSPPPPPPPGPPPLLTWDNASEIPKILNTDYGTLDTWYKEHSNKSNYALTSDNKVILDDVARILTAYEFVGNNIKNLEKKWKKIDWLGEFYDKLDIMCQIRDNSFTYKMVKLTILADTYKTEVMKIISEKLLEDLNGKLQEYIVKLGDLSSASTNKILQISSEIYGFFYKNIETPFKESTLNAFIDNFVENFTAHVLEAYNKFKDTLQKQYKLIHDQLVKAESASASASGSTYNVVDFNDIKKLYQDELAKIDSVFDKYKSAAETALQDKYEAFGHLDINSVAAQKYDDLAAAAAAASVPVRTINLEDILKKNETDMLDEVTKLDASSGVVMLDTDKVMYGTSVMTEEQMNICKAAIDGFFNTDEIEHTDASGKTTKFNIFFKRFASVPTKSGGYLRICDLFNFSPGSTEFFIDSFNKFNSDKLSPYMEFILMTKAFVELKSSPEKDVSIDSPYLNENCFIAKVKMYSNDTGTYFKYDVNKTGSKAEIGLIDMSSNKLSTVKCVIQPLNGTDLDFLLMNANVTETEHAFKIQVGGAYYKKYLKYKSKYLQIK